MARSRLGETDVARGLQTTLEQTRRASERYLMVRCLEALSEVALASGDTAGCLKYADELLDIALQNGLRELEASARRWRGEALLADKAFVHAGEELSRAAQLAEEIGRVRLQLDAQAALARLLSAKGQHPAAQRHRANAHAIADAVEKSLASSGLKAHLRVDTGPR